MKKYITIGNSSGFWGDDPGAMLRQLTGGPLDYLTCDYLAEVSMSILRKQELRNPAKGYVQDFIKHLDISLETLIENGTRLITNAGGNNPYNCAKAVQELAQNRGINLKVAIIEGDQFIDRLDELIQEGNSLTHLDTHEEIHKKKELFTSANVYYGVPPLLSALKSDAQVIITGRATDSSLAMAPMIHEFGWALDDWQKMGTAMVAAHCIECGTQISGGNFTDWQLVTDWNNMGYPILEVHPNGDFYVTKHTNTGGLISSDTVKEQLVYEIADPTRYMGPDVIANLEKVRIKQVAPHKVLVTGISGMAPTSFLKASMSYHGGYKAIGSIIISGPNALDKANTFASIFWERLALSFEKQSHELVGHNATHLGLAKNQDPNEILLRLHCMDNDKAKVNQFSRLIASLILSGPPGVAVTGGRPRIQEVLAYWPSLLHKRHISLATSLVSLDGTKTKIHQGDTFLGHEEESTPIPLNQIESLPWEGAQQVALIRLCLSRSGDKGNHTNLGVLARNETIYSYLLPRLTSDWIKEQFKSFGKGAVTRYELPEIHGFNFLLEDSLDGGGTLSQRIDAQGKTFASALLQLEVRLPESVLSSLRHSTTEMYTEPGHPPDE